MITRRRHVQMCLGWMFAGGGAAALLAFADMPFPVWVIVFTGLALGVCYLDALLHKTT